MGGLTRPLSPSPPHPKSPPPLQKPARRDFTRGFNLPFSETDPTETVLRQRRGCRAFSHGIQWGQGWIGLSVELYRVSLSALCSRWGVARRIEGGRRSVEKGDAGRAWKGRRNDLWWEREREPPLPPMLVASGNFLCLPHC